MSYNLFHLHVGLVRHLPLHGPFSGPGHNMPPQWGQITFLSGWRQSFSSGTARWGFLLQLLNLSLPAFSPKSLPLLSLGKVIRIHGFLRRMPVI